MGKVRAQAIMSLDGYVAKRGQDHRQLVRLGCTTA